MLTRRHSKVFRETVTRWIRNLFLPLFFDSGCPYLDCIYNLEALLTRADFVLDRIFNYLFVRRFDEDAVQHVLVCTFMSMERDLIRQQTVEGVALVLNRPRQYMNLEIFDQCLY